MKMKSTQTDCLREKTLWESIAESVFGEKLCGSSHRSRSLEQQ